MLRKFARLFTIKNRFEAYAVIYAIAVATVDRGELYLDRFPGWFGYFLFAACTVAVFMGGAKILDATRPKRRRGEERRKTERRADALGA